MRALAGRDQQSIPRLRSVAAAQLAQIRSVRSQAAEVQVEGVRGAAVPALALHQLRDGVLQLAPAHVLLVAHVVHQRLTEAHGLRRSPALDSIRRAAPEAQEEAVLGLLLLCFRLVLLMNIMLLDIIIIRTIRDPGAQTQS